MASADWKTYNRFIVSAKPVNQAAAATAIDDVKVDFFGKMLLSRDIVTVAVHNKLAILDALEGDIPEHGAEGLCFFLFRETGGCV